MAVEIDWKPFNAAKKNLTHSICVGEERTLSEVEVVKLNDALAALFACSVVVDDLLKIAENRFRDGHSWPAP